MKKILSTFIVILILMSLNVMAQDKSKVVSDGLPPRMQNPVNPIIAADNLLAWDSRAFACNAYGTGAPLGPLKMFLNTPGTLTSLATDNGAFFCAGSFDGSGNWWAVRYTLGLYKIDTTTGNRDSIATINPAGSITGIAWDFATGTMFAMNYISASSASQLGSLNLTTGAFTPIGSPYSGLIIDIACSNSGQLYGVNISTDVFVSIDKVTGAVTTIGSLNAAANYAQGLSWDHSTDSCFWAAYTTQGELRRIDVATGNSTLIGTFAGGSEIDAFAIPGAPGPMINHTPLPNTQNLAGPYVVNASITVTGSTIAGAKIYWSRNNPVITDSVVMTNPSGSNWTGNIPGNNTAATYRYYIAGTDALGRVGTSPPGAPAVLHSFLAIASDTTKPVITHTPIVNCPRAQWPTTVNCTASDPFGIDSVWVGWYKNSTSNPRQRFNLTRGTGNSWSGVFNSDTTQVAVGDSIGYRVIARDASAQHNMDSTVIKWFPIINQVTLIIGTGTTSSNFPFTTYWMDGRTQYLYLASELGLPTGQFAEVGFNVITVGAPVMNGFKINMQHTSLTSLSGWVTTGWTTCFAPASWTPTAPGWNMIQLTSPFQYNGTDNLLVEVCYNNSSYTSYSTVNSTPVAGMYWGRYGDLSNDDGCTYTAWTLTTAPPGRANTKFVYNPGPMGITNLNNEIPTTYALSQNYPNPFNPVTKINFALPKQGFVTMKIYDVLGREVRTLVNEVRNAGNYIVEFNANELASGVYFYKLEVNGFSDVKRMMLIK